MTQAMLEERLNVLEKKLAELQAQVQKLVRPNDWRSAVGIFGGDEGMKQVFEEGQKTREADRKKTRNAGRTKQAKSKR